MPALSWIVLRSALPVPLMSAVPVEIQVLDIVGQREIDARVDKIGALVRLFDHLVAGVLHVVMVVAGATGEHVEPGVAGKPVVEPVAGAVDVAIAGQYELLDVVAERV